MRALHLLVLLSLPACSFGRVAPGPEPHWAVGCYAVSAGPWNPSAGGPRTQLPPRVELPQVLHLQADRRESRGHAGFRVRTEPALGAIPGEPYWRRAASDSIRVIWEGGTIFHGYELLMGRQGEELIGTFGPYSDVPGRDQFIRPVRLQRIRCPGL